MFGDIKINNKHWSVNLLKDVVIIDTKMTADFNKYAEYPHIGIENIEKDTGLIKNYKLVKDCNLKSGKYIFDNRHLIYSKIRPNLNKVAKPDFTGLCSADAYPLLPTNKINRDFLAIVLRSNYFLEYILSYSSRTNIPKVNKAQLEKFKLPIPPKELQNQFTNFIKQVDKSKFEIQRSLDKLETLKKSLMQEYFA